MTTVLGFKSLATSALVLAAVTACGSNSSDPPTTTPASPSSSTPATTTSSSPTSPSEIAAANAEAAVHRYFGVLDHVRKDPSVPLSALSKVAISTQLSAQQNLVSGERSKGLRQTGATRIDELKVQAVNLDDSQPSVGKVPTVTVDVCWDVSEADLIDKSGQSVVKASRADTGWTRYTVANYHWSKNPSDGWRIATSQDLKRTSCAAS
jgi:hypothetical protein